MKIKATHTKSKQKMLSLTATNFVAAIETIVVEITSPMRRDTTAISALKLG